MDKIQKNSRFFSGNLPSHIQYMYKVQRLHDTRVGILQNNKMGQRIDIVIAWGHICFIDTFCSLAAGRAADVAHLECACYYGQTGKNLHCRSKEHVSKFNSKSEKIRSESAFHIYCRIMHKNANNVKLRGIVLLDSRYVVIWELLSFKIVPLPHNHQSVWKPLR